MNAPIDLARFGSLMPPGRLPNGRPMREGLLLVRPANVAPLLAACDGVAALGIAHYAELGEAERAAWSLAVGPFELLRPICRLPFLWPDGVVVLELVGPHVPGLLGALASSSATALDLPPVKASRLILPT